MKIQTPDLGLKAPKISGTPQVGQVLTATNFTLLYQWNRAGLPIPGATSPTYTPVPADVGNVLTVSSMTTDGADFSAQSTSPPTSPVIDGIPVNTALPTISGTAQVGQTLTATTGTWTNSPTSFTYQWNRAGTPIGGATASAYVPVAVDVGSTLTVSVVAINSGGSSSPATSAATSAVIDIIPTNVSLPTISGTAQVGQTLTATTGTWTHNPTSFTYQWNRAGTPIGGATASTYVPIAADVGSTLTVSVVAINSGGSSSPATSTATSAVIDIIPTNVSLPAISGTAQVGQTLTATTGTWTHNPTSFTYQWKRAGTPIGGATASTYVPIAADVGSTLTVSVVATNSGGSSAPATSAPTAQVAPVAPAIPVNTAIPTISGTSQVGQTLTASNGTWTNNPTSFAYQWKTSKPIFSSTFSSVNAGWPGFQGRQIIPPANLGNPGITTGFIRISFTLTSGSSNGTLNGAYVGAQGSGNAINFDGNQIPIKFGGATSRTGLGPGVLISDLIPFTFDAAKALVISSAWSGANVDAGENTSSTGNIGAYSETDLDPSVTIPPSPTKWAQLQNTVHFISKIELASVAISGATASTYVPVAADVGNSLMVAVVATNPGGSSTPATSAATSPVAAAVPVNTVLPTISGTAQVGQTLTATTGTWTNNPTSFAYQWKRAGTPISGATASTYVPVAADVGNALTVSVIATNSGGSSAPATSAATPPVTTASGVSLATYGGDWDKAMAAAKTNGNLITVPAGTWPSPQIRPYAGLTIRGAGAGVAFVTRNAPGTQNDGGLFKVTVPNVTITDLTARGWPKAQGLSDDILINALFTTNLTVQRVNLEDAQGIGIQPEGVTGSLFEDVKITNTLLRYNGAHGVALWPYKGTSNCIFRRISINGAIAGGVVIDAGTTGSTDAKSCDNNTFTDVTVVNGSTSSGYGAILITGGSFNKMTNTTVTDLTSGPAFNFGIDQSGLGSNSNTFTTTTLARISSGALAWFASTTCSNTFDGGSGSYTVNDPGRCNNLRNWPGLVIR